MNYNIIYILNTIALKVIGNLALSRKKFQLSTCVTGTCLSAQQHTHYKKCLTFKCLELLYICREEKGVTI